MERIRVDFNRKGREGMLVSSITRASGAVAEGDYVEVYQPGEDEMTTTALVSDIAPDGRLLLRVRAVPVFTFTFSVPGAPLWSDTSHSDVAPILTRATGQLVGASG